MSPSSRAVLARVWRPLLIAVVTWFVASALFAPWLNPVMVWQIKRKGETVMLLQQARNEMALIREEAVSSWMINDRWPDDVQLPGVHAPGTLAMEAEVPADFHLLFQFGPRFPAQSRLRGTSLLQQYQPGTDSWTCRPGPVPPPDAMIPVDCRVSEPWTLIDWLGLLLILSVLVLLGLGSLWWALRPAVGGVLQQPQRLLRHPIAALPLLHRQLGWLRLRQSTLLKAGIASTRWRDALTYAAAGADARAALLAARVGATSTPSADWALPGRVHQWRLPASLPIALDTLCLYLPDPELPPTTVVQRLRELRNGQDIVLVVSPGIDADAALLAYADDPLTLCACLDQATQTEWLLKPHAVDVLVALLARQLKATRISPYQTHGGVTRASAFFGRESLLARVLNREPGNYLLVGGRQLGKTSLMKAIERRFDGHPRMHCRYLSLRDHRLSPRLAMDLRLPVDTPIDVLVDAMVEQAGGRRLLLLVDECDLFIRAEASAGYPLLNTLRALSEEGRCHFMLAGFWDLYEAAMLDYASPIRNFGEVIHLGGLEREACVSLATEPMARLGIHFADPGLPSSLIAACGQRANLVAIVCQQLLEQLERGQRLIDSSQLHTALRSVAVLDALSGWARLSPDPQACQVDRILVYYVAQATHAVGGAASRVTLAGLLEYFDQAGIVLDAEVLRHALARLQLAYVLGRSDSGEHYVFNVPLFASQFDPGEVNALLARELQSLRAVSPD